MINRRIEWTYTASCAKLRMTVYDDGGLVHRQLNHYYPFGLELANIGMTGLGISPFSVSGYLALLIMQMDSLE